MLRTHTCGELTAADEGKTISLCGWTNSNRDHGGLIFIDLRDKYGMTQIVFDPDIHKDNHATAEHLRREDVLRITGRVEKRKEGMTNPNLATGEIEVIVQELEVLAKSETPPIEIDDRNVANDDMRLKYRYLDLRRPIMQKNMQLRYEANRAAREFFHDHKFIEIETPYLVRSTPEGARDYVVPSRVHPGKFYALPQSPQLYKQILMIASFDRYFQFPRCLRDEDLRADRQPEHTQMDFEMSFIDSNDIMEFVEGLFGHICKKTFKKKIEEKFVRLTYDEAMDKYGIDKPDLRFGLELCDVSEIVKDSDFSVFKEIVERGGVVKCINPEHNFPRKEIDGLIEFCQKAGAKGMAWMRVTENGLESNIAKFFNEDVQRRLLEETGAKAGSVLMFIADKKQAANNVLAVLRNELGRRLELYDPKELKFCWITDFPLFEWDEESRSWQACHHIFSMPKKECLEFIESDPSKVYGDLFDVVLNGVELGSGSMRINKQDIQERVMKVIGLEHQDVEDKFGFLLEAYKYGGPPHGGMGLGFDRFLAIMLGTNDIREAIAFPKNKSAVCPMDNCPNDVDPVQMRDLHIKTDIAKPKE